MQSGHSIPQVTMSSVLVRSTDRIGSGSNRKASSTPAANSTSKCRIPAARSIAIAAHRIGLDDLCRAPSRLQQIRPGVRQVHVVAARLATQRGLRDGERQPRQRPLRIAHGSSAGWVTWSVIMRTMFSFKVRSLSRPRKWVCQRWNGQVRPRRGRGTTTRRGFDVAGSATNQQVRPMAWLGPSSPTSSLGHPVKTRSVALLTSD